MVDTLVFLVAGDNLVPVSYTHLDVYKRQPSIRCGAVPFGIAPYQLVHELRRHRTAFAHYTAFIVSLIHISATVCGAVSAS